MATVTNWFKFKKPEVSDAADIGVINENMDMLDGLLGSNIYVAHGVIFDSASGNVRGIGTATVTVEAATGCARIDFSIQITQDGVGTTDFLYGIDRDALRTINPNIPLITPVTGGVVTVYSASDTGATVSQAATHYGGLLSAHSNKKYWNLARVYDLNTDGVTGKVGAWPQSTFKTLARLVGTCYGKVEG